MARLDVGEKSILKLLSFDEAEGKKHIIPAYQRPYAWEKDQCENLWNDIKDFYKLYKGGKKYYLGTVVVCESKEESGNFEVVDGQQRITSFLLLLRAFYAKLEKNREEGKVDRLIGNIESCVWERDSISGAVENKETVRIESRVVTGEHGDIFHKILRDGKIEKGKTNYEKNYQFFCEESDKYAADDPRNWEKFVNFILEGCIVFPIETDDSETALTIFSTLNDRGMSLTDPDILRYRMYQQCPKDRQQEFVDRWRDLEEMREASQSHQYPFTLSEMFRYYSHYLRGGEKTLTNEVKPRAFYDPNRLKNWEVVMDHLRVLAEFWGDVSHIKSEYLTTRGRQYMHCLLEYPNDRWCDIVSVFLLVKRDEEDFAQQLEEQLAELTAFFYAKFVVAPGINPIKQDIYHACAQLRERGKVDRLKGESATLESDLVRARIEEVSRRKSVVPIKKGLLLLHTYLDPNQRDDEHLVDVGFDVEHIFPRNWQDTNYKGWSKDAARQHLDRLGNLIPLEKKLNIQAGNDYFGKKKERYKVSAIAEVKKLSQYHENDWVKDDIEKREVAIIDTLMDFFARQGVLK